MPRQVIPLTDAKCRQARYKPTGGNRIFDGGGLYLEMMKSGAKFWRMKYRRPGTKKETSLTFGQYPNVPLAKAREQRAAAQAHLHAGLDPAVQRDLARTAAKIAAADTFEVIAQEWLATRVDHWSPAYLERMTSALKTNAYPYFGKIAIAKVSGKLVLDTVRRVECRGALEMAARVLSSVGQVFRYAVGTGRAPADVTYGLEQFLEPKPPVEHHPHVELTDLPGLLLRVEGYHGRPETRLAIKIMMRTFVRTNELRWTQWTEWDRPNALWTVPSDRMKGTRQQKLNGPPHLVPLSRQVLALLDELEVYSGRYAFLFPGIRQPGAVPMSSETINRALEILGYGEQQTGHGFRGLASTILNETGRFRDRAIEAQLAHKDKNKVRRAYNHAQYLEERREIMQWWSDYLDDQLSRAHKPIPLP
ncbi:integrase arm-type DNA-binding domain-containing protein [Achromobacter sp. SIMBA_011]|uniref:tyrosine-type recombinase/integrase n=1 Tax=Achromobacter TaxID=222 RepID=UPI0009ED37E9|nr:integrase arm-type DNA-binding domain-containing protein [Achromobacter ruhlandii]